MNRYGRRRRQLRVLVRGCSWPLDRPVRVLCAERVLVFQYYWWRGWKLVQITTRGVPEQVIWQLGGT